MRVDSLEYLELQNRLVKNSAMMLSHATKLRLTPQADVDGRSKVTEEHGDASAAARLIGGAALKVVR
jgi:hypothetical protein